MYTFDSNITHSGISLASGSPEPQIIEALAPFTALPADSGSGSATPDPSAAQILTDLDQALGTAETRG